MGLSVFVLIFVALYKMLKQGSKDWKIIQKDLTEFAKNNSFTYVEAPFIQFAGKNLLDIDVIARNNNHKF